MYAYFSKQDINIKFKLFFLLYISFVSSFITEVPDTQLDLFLFILIWQSGLWALATCSPLLNCFSNSVFSKLITPQHAMGIQHCQHMSNRDHIAYIGKGLFESYPHFSRRTCRTSQFCMLKINADILLLQDQWLLGALDVGP